MLGQLIGGFIVILVGVTLIPSVADSILEAQCGGNIINTTLGETCNVSGASSTILGLTTLFFAIAVTASGIAIATQGLKSAGMM
jgi:hypothetical protein